MTREENMTDCLINLSKGSHKHARKCAKKMYKLAMVVLPPGGKK